MNRAHAQPVPRESLHPSLQLQSSACGTEEMEYLVILTILLKITVLGKMARLTTAVTDIRQRRRHELEACLKWVKGKKKGISIKFRILLIINHKLN